MDSKVILAVVAVAVIAVAGLAVLGMGSDDTHVPDDCIVYHGNGGLSNGQESVNFSGAEIPVCTFTNEGKHFYKWNTEADASGDFFDPKDAAAYSKLVSSGVKDLYAIWVFQLTASFSSSSSGPNTITTILINQGSFIDAQPVSMFPCKLDSSASKARIGFGVLDASGSTVRDVSWTYDEASRTFTGASTMYTYSVTRSSTTGFSSIDVLDPDNGVIAFDFGYSSDVTISLKTSIVRA